MREIMKIYDLISKRVSRLAESPTLRLLAQVGELQAQGKKIFGFHIGEPDFDIPPNVAKAIKDAVADKRSDLDFGIICSLTDALAP